MFQRYEKVVKQLLVIRFYDDIEKTVNMLLVLGRNAETLDSFTTENVDT